MTKWALFAVAGFFGICQSLSAQPPEQMPFESATLDRPSIQSLELSLENSDRFFFSSAFGSMRATEEFLPSFDPSEPLSMGYLPSVNRGDSIDRVIDLRAPDRIRFGGEVGFLYGKSTGKYGREDFAGYIIGTMGTDKFSISVGALHRESSFNVPRRRR